MLFTVTLYAIVAVGLNIVTGYAGLLDLGYVGFYADGRLHGRCLHGVPRAWPFLLVLPLAMVVTLLTGILLGAPTLRVRGDYLAIVTMGFGELIRITIRNTEWLGGPGGIKAIPSPHGLGRTRGPVQDPAPPLGWAEPAHRPRAVDEVSASSACSTRRPYFWLALTALIIVIFARRS